LAFSRLQYILGELCLFLWVESGYKILEVNTFDNIANLFIGLFI
jgi:hypothetical protein